MSRLSEILGVKEGQEFRYGNQQRTYKVVGEHFYIKKDNQCFWNNYTNKFIEMIAHPELIHPIPKKLQLTDQQITAIKGRIAEGTPWAARDRDGDNTIYFFPNKPNTNSIRTSWHAIDNDDNKFVTVGSNKNNIYDFITFENSPVYLPDLIGE